MNDKVILLVHPSPRVRERLGAALDSAGAKVMRAVSDDDAWSKAEQVLEPDGVVAYLDIDSESGDRWIGDRVRARTSDLPVVVLTEDRRLALRKGFMDVVGAPFDEEEVVLVTRLALERRQPERNLSGDLDKMSLPDLLQTSSTNGRSGHVVVRRRGRTGEIWMRDGRVIDARLDEPGGRSLTGREAVFEMVTWEEGSFAVNFGPVTVPERITEATTLLVLEAMRRLDESRRRSEPGHAGLPDEPPAPTREEKAAHHALLLLNVSVSWVSGHLLPKVLAERLEQSRRRAVKKHPLLDRLRVDPETGRVAYRSRDETPSSDEVESTAEAVAAWLRFFFETVERAIPGRYDLEQLAVLTGAHQEEMVELGFAAALEWSDPVAEEPSAVLPTNPENLTVSIPLTDSEHAT